MSYKAWRRLIRLSSSQLVTAEQTDRQTDIMTDQDIEKQPAPAAPPQGTHDLKVPESSPEFYDNTQQYVNADRLARKLSARQVQMIAIGGTIGTGLFLGTGKALEKGGPASTLIAYAICGGIVFVTMLSLGEMAAFVPVAGSFCTYAGYDRHPLPCLRFKWFG